MRLLLRVGQTGIQSGQTKDPGYPNHEREMVNIG